MKKRLSLYFPLSQVNRNFDKYSENYEIPHLKKKKFPDFQKFFKVGIT